MTHTKPQENPFKTTQSPKPLKKQTIKNHNVYKTKYFMLSLVFFLDAGRPKTLTGTNTKQNTYPKAPRQKVLKGDMFYLLGIQYYHHYNKSKSKHKNNLNNEKNKNKNKNNKNKNNNNNNNKNKKNKNKNNNKSNKRKKNNKANKNNNRSSSNNNNNLLKVIRMLELRA